MTEACRVCRSTSVRAVGEVEYYAGYSWSIYDCADCKCRFTRHDERVYDLLHATGAISYYSEYRALAAQARSLFNQHDSEGLASLLSRSSKYRFIINALAAESRDARILEVGCSRGYLTSLFILEGRNILGIDVSAEAVEGSVAAFGSHFALTDSRAAQAGAPYDVIYHVGMIGCVADPVALTKHLLGMLKPGGRLLFNAPNRESCTHRNQLWIDSAPPPDLVTLFPPGFWEARFGKVADVTEQIEMCSSEKSLEIGLRKMFCRGWIKPIPLPLAASNEKPTTRSHTFGSAWRCFEKVVLKLGRFTRLSRVVPLHPFEFGLFVSMTKR